MSYKWEHSGIFIQVEQSYAFVTVLMSPFQLWLCVFVFVQLHSTRFPVVQNFSNLKRLVSLVPRLSLAAFMFSSAGGQRPKTQGPVCAASTSMGTYMKSTTLERHPDKIWQKLHLPWDWIGLAGLFYLSFLWKKAYQISCRTIKYTRILVTWQRELFLIKVPSRRLKHEFWC